jgi:acetylornithine deacetylase
MTELEQLLSDLVAIESVNPALDPQGAGEGEVARFVARWLADRGFDVSVDDVAPGRPNVVGRRGGGSGRRLLLLAHTDTVAVGGAPAPRIEDGRLHGRGSYDMKAGLAAAMDAAAALDGIAGEVVVAAVCDEEAGGLGTRALLATDARFDAAIVTEPTDLDVAIAHKGFVGFEIETRGVAAHGSRPDLGVDAILAMAPVLAELRELDRRMQAGRRHPLLGTASLHASVIDGGQEFSTYPDRCVLTGECRTLPGDDAEAELRAVVERCGAEVELRITYVGEPLENDADSEIVQLLHQSAGTSLTGMAYWADSAQVAAAGTPTVLFGPLGGGAHADDEWVDLASVQRVRDVLVAAAQAFLRL